MVNLLSNYRQAVEREANEYLYQNILQFLKYIKYSINKWINFNTDKENIVRLLVNKGASIDVKDVDGKTALDIATQRGNHRIFT